MFSKRYRRNTDVEDIDITSLLDILVILLVFLLKSFNDSELSVELANELSLPYSLSRVAGHDGTILQVNARKQVFLNSSVIGDIASEKTKKDLVSKLNEEFTRRSEKSKKLDPKKGFIINFVFDRALEYRVINEIMDLSAKTGFNKYKLVIQGED